MFPPSNLAQPGAHTIRPAEDAMAAQEAAEGFSRLASVARALDGTVQLSITANDDERAALAVRFGLLSLDRLAAEATLTAAEMAGSVRLIARWSADVIQSCVVTLEPVASQLADGFEQVFAPAAMIQGLGDDHMLIDVEAADPPEPLTGEAIDVGALVAEQVALALDPYPRRPDAELPAAYVAGAEDGGKRESPFAKLREVSGTS
jgi:hypothetical protein